ncbi:MAG: aspartate/glutamate racemase family protein [Clostridia bacterium]|nr:aspartate/glutamate racemase family protein [Clostridia bacterium]
MIGVFDSGLGGENVIRAIRSRSDAADLVFFADRANAPYGTKSESELIRLTESSIERLVSAGCKKILIACCTASTVHPLIRRELADLSIPIIAPTARDALSATGNGKIAVIATDATVRSHAFRRALGSGCTIEIAASRLVDEIEAGASDGNIDSELKNYLYTILSPLGNTDTDTLVLGCTHFVRLRGEIEKALYDILNKQIITVDSSEAAAGEIFSSPVCDLSGEGRLLRI